jgi:hypothetical protein
MKFTLLRAPTSNATQSNTMVDRRTTSAGPPHEHYHALARMVSEVSQDHAQLRTFVYEFARFKLRKDLYPQFLEGAWPEIEEQVRGLEAAIDRMESEFGADPPRLQFSLPSGLVQSQTVPNPAERRAGEPAIDFRSLARAPDDASSPPAFWKNDRAAFPGKPRNSRFWWYFQLIAATAIGLIIFVSVDVDSVLYRLGIERLEPATPRRALINVESVLKALGLRWSDGSSQVDASTEIVKEHNPSAGRGELASDANKAIRQSGLDVPVPTEYGAYAVVDGQLVELERLPIKIPDPRVAISASISTASRTHLPVTRPEFVIFRRDLGTSAPDRITVRIIAQVMRALSFDQGGNAKITDLNESWVIRNNSYQMRVAPLPDSPEMIVVRPDPLDFVFPAGRYALVLKDVGYDFTVDGPMTDMTHCLERTDALGAPIYSECRKP